MNEYEKLLDDETTPAQVNPYEEVDDQDKVRLRASLYSSIGVNPDSYAKSQQLAARSKLPAPIVDRNFDTVDRRTKLQEYEALLQDDPALRDRFADPEFAKIAHDDVPNLKGITAEMRAIQPQRPTFGSYVKGVLNAIETGGKRTKLGLEQMFHDLVGARKTKGAEQAAQAEFQRRSRALDLQEEILTPGFKTKTAEGIYAGVTSTAQMVPGIAASVALGNPAPAIASAGVITGAPAYSKYRGRGGTVAESLKGAGGEAAVEMGFELLPMGFLVKKLGKAQAGEFLTGYFGRELPTELATTLAQNAIDTAVANPEKTWSQYVAEQPEAMYKTALAVAVMTSSMGVANAGLGAFARRAQQAQEAEQARDIADRLVTLATESKVRERNPEKLEEALAQALKDEPAKEVFIDAQKLDELFQDRVDDILGDMPEARAQFAQAVASGGDVTIPIAQFATRMAAKPEIKRLLDHIRFTADGMSAAESKEFLAGAQKEMESQAEALIAESLDQDATRSSAEAVKTDIKAKLGQAAAFRPEVNDAYATYASSFYTVLGSRLGITPEEAYAKHPFNLNNQTLPELAFEQPMVATDTPEFQSWFGKSRAVDADGKPILVYRGEHGATTDGALQSKLPSLTFTDSADVASVYAENPNDPSMEAQAPRVVPAHVSIQNPIIENRDDPFVDLSDLVPKLGQDVVVQLALRHEAAIRNTGNWQENYAGKYVSVADLLKQNPGEVANLYMDAFPLLDDPEFVAAAKAAGFDGAIHVGNGESMDALEFRVFDPSQVKGAFEPQQQMVTLWRAQRRGKPIKNWFAVSKEMALDYYGMYEEEGVDLYRLDVPFEDADRYIMAASKRDDAAAEGFGGGGEAYVPRAVAKTAKKVSLEEAESYKQSATIRAGQETLLKYGLDPTKKYKTREVAAALEARQRAKYGIIEADDRTGVSYTAIGEWMATEVEFEMQNPEKSGVGWYSEKFQRALDEMANLFPELAKDKVARNTMTALIAITSDGQKVVPNFAQALDIYGRFRKGGETEGQFTSGRSHIRQASIDNNLQIMQRLYDQMGPEAMHEYLMQEKTVSQLKQIARANGGEFKSAYQAHIKMPMAAVEFGPKLGAFYANLMGAHGYLTMDRWWSRTFNRYRGTLLMAPTKEGLARFRDLMGHPEWSDDETIAATIEPTKSYEKKGFKNGTEIEKAANTIHKAAFDGLEDAPFNATDRTFMLDAVEAARKSLAKRGYNLSIADIQAILWYYEKRLYGELGARQSADISYEDAARRVVAGYASGSGDLSVRGGQEGAGSDSGTAEDGVPVGEEEFEPDELEQTNRGSFAPSTRTITLLKDADLSTFLHEFGHFQLEVMTDIAIRPQAPAEIRQDVDALLKWFGVKDLDTWNVMSLEDKRPHHEKFARGMEAYLLRGESPSEELRGVFARFRAWLLHIYKSIKALNVTLTPEVTQVFDRMLASEEQIRATEATRGYRSIFQSMEESGMTPEEWQAHQSLANQSTTDAVEELERRSLKDMQWLSNAKSRELSKIQGKAKKVRKAVRDQVEAEVAKQPVYAARAFLRENKGIDKQIAADMFGFTSVDHMQKALAEAPPIAETIEGMTDQRMLEEHGELVDERSIERAADAAIHNLARAKFVASELSALERAIEVKVNAGTDRKGRRRSVNVLAKAAKDYARVTVGRMKVRDARHAHRHSIAEGRASRLAEAAFKKGKLEEAAMHKRSQILANALFTESHKATDEIEKTLAYFKKFDSAGVREKLDVEYLDQVDALLEAIDLRKGVSQKDLAKRAALRDWIESQQEMGIEPTLDPRLIETIGRTHYTQLTLEQMRGLRAAIENIEHLGRLKQKLLTAKDQREFDAAVDEIVTSIDLHARGRTVNNRTGNTPTDAASRLFKGYLASHRKISSLARQMDGSKDGGPVWEYFIRSMNEAGDRETTMREQATVKLARLLQPLQKGSKLGGRGLYIRAIERSLNREARIAVALNVGNAGNKQRLMSGEAWSEDQLQAVLDTLTQEDWTFVQSIWDLFEEYRPLVAEKERRVTGVEPEWIDASPVQTRFGEFRGGYYPVKYDPRASAKAEEHADAEGARMMMRAAYTSATTRRSFTKARAQEVIDRPLALSFDGIYQGITEVIHDLAWHEWLIDTNRLLKNKRINASIRNHYGAEVVQQFKRAFQDIARGEAPAQNEFEAGLNYIRHGTTVVGLGWNVMTSLLQPLGLAQSAVRIGPRYLFKGLGDWLAHPKQALDDIYSKSEFMRVRAKTLQREINEIRNQVSGDKGKVKNAVEVSYFMLIQKAQLIADVPTWLGAYEKAIVAGNDEARSVSLADQAVIDSQGGGQIKDLSAIQRGSPALKLFTNFISYFNVTYNLAAERARATNFKSPGQVTALAVDYLLLMVVPSVVGSLIRAGLDDDDDDLESLAKRLAGDQISYLMGLMVGLREVTSAAQYATNTKPFPTTYSGPAGVRFFSEMEKLGKQIGQGDLDMALFNSGINVAGIALHLPTGQVKKTVEGSVALMEGETDNPAVLVTGT
jgi:hypothetical protein